MRLIAGKFRGRRLERPSDAITRPTSDRTRESIFNILMSHSDIDMVDAEVMDVFAGTGAMGLEALSRGAHHVIFVEQHPVVIKVLKQNIATLRVEDETTVIQGDAIQIFRKGREVFQQSAHPERRSVEPKSNGLKLILRTNLIFLDPPYDQNLEGPTLLALRQGGWLSPQTVIVLETSVNTNISEILNAFTLTDQRTYGAAKVSFLRIREP